MALALAGARAEPQPPDVLDLVITGPGKTAGSVNVEAVIKQNIDSAVELEVDAASGAVLQSGGRKKPYTLKRGSAEVREKLEVNVSDGKPRTVKVKMRLLDAAGKPWMIINREVELNKPTNAAKSDEERVPVVHTLPDGTRVVERISRKEALARGLPEGGKPAPSFRRIPMGKKPTGQP